MQTKFHINADSKPWCYFNMFDEIGFGYEIKHNRRIIYLGLVRILERKVSCCVGQTTGRWHQIRS